MERQFDLIRQTRNLFLKIVDGLSIDELNEIPEGMSNNIAWNFGHIIAAQQGLCNGLSGVAMNVVPESITDFKKGTKPERYISKEEIDQFKEYMVSNIDALEKDVKAGNVFTKYQPYTTSYGFALNNIDDAIKFFAVHDALHLGYAMAIRKNIKSKINS
ncbi:DinB family protein [Ferruginibacter sp. SUN002]|uniref:DinB family protein n=1 Tax=Ferruginibacter sp. SUN002 TaxID=2937789 RepID=UPI003D366102